MKMPVPALGARLEQHGKAGEVAVMANLMMGSIRRRVSKMGRAELVLSPIASTCLSEDVALSTAHTTPLEAIVLQGQKQPKSNHAEPIRATYLASVAGHEETEAISVCP